MSGIAAVTRLNIENRKTRNGDKECAPRTSRSRNPAAVPRDRRALKHRNITQKMNTKPASGGPARFPSFEGACRCPGWG